MINNIPKNEFFFDMFRYKKKMKEKKKFLKLNF